MSPKIFARNLTARAAMEIAGNPVTTRLESGVSNCFPGLEFDHRNLDRRFFPGLVFEFVSSGRTLRQGVRLLEVNAADPDLSPETFESNPVDRPDLKTQARLRSELQGRTGNELRKGDWFLDAVEQAGKQIDFHDRTKAKAPLAAMTSWRLIHSLERGPVSITLVRREEKKEKAAARGGKIKLVGWRRIFVDSNTGVISDAYTPGELSQSLCSPWMHDFRDCACTYWASNHPDIVLAEVLPSDPSLPSGASADPERANTPIDWLRSDRSRDRAAAAEPTEGANRPWQMDHYDINRRWQALAIVLGGQETSRIYDPLENAFANPFPTPDVLASTLASLAGLEHALALEYLYARYSLENPEKVNDKTLSDVLVFARHEMLRIAVSEMRHLRWANQLIWELEHAGLTTQKFGPSLGIADKIPFIDAKGQHQERPRALQTLTDTVLQDFIGAEQPSGTIEGKYARVLATLREPCYPAPLHQLAASIIADGMEHYSRFRDIQKQVIPYFADKPLRYMRNLTPADPSLADGAKAKQLYAQIVDELNAAYLKGDMEDAVHIANARRIMFELDSFAEALAAKGMGVPFF